MLETLGKYRIDGYIAEGGMARILRAKTEGVGGIEKTVALKCLKGHMQEDDSFVQMLLDEARITVRMTHKNICQVYGLEHDGDKYFMVMEYIDGINLAQLSRYLFEKNRVFPVEAAVFIVMEVCSGLSYAHRMLDEHGENLGIVHRDVNPQNICLSREGEVKLIDFGIAKAHTTTSETQAGMIKGKFNYMSPEQARGDRVDQRTDVFALGAVLYEMLCGHMLYPLSTDETRLWNKIKMAEFVPIESYLPDIPETLRKIITKALTRDVNQRFATSRDFLLALTKFFHESCKVYDSINLSMLVEKYLKCQGKVECSYDGVTEHGAFIGKYSSNETLKAEMQMIPNSGSGTDISVESGDTAVISTEEAQKIAGSFSEMEAELMDEAELDDSATSVYSKAAFEAAVNEGKCAYNKDSSLAAELDLSRSVDLEVVDLGKGSTVMVPIDEVQRETSPLSVQKLISKILSLDEKTLFIAAAVLAGLLILAIILYALQ